LSNKYLWILQVLPEKLVVWKYDHEFAGYDDGEIKLLLKEEFTSDTEEYRVVSEEALKCLTEEQLDYWNT